MLPCTVSLPFSVHSIFGTDQPTDGQTDKMTHRSYKGSSNFFVPFKILSMRIFLQADLVEEKHCQKSSASIACVIVEVVNFKLVNIIHNMNSGL